MELKLYKVIFNYTRETYHPKGCLNFAHLALIAAFAALKDLYERIRTKFSANYAKQSQSQVLRNYLSSLTTSKYGTGTFGEMRKQSQNKPNSNPIQSQSKPIMRQKLGWQSQFKPNQTQFYPERKPALSKVEVSRQAWSKRANSREACRVVDLAKAKAQA